MLFELSEEKTDVIAPDADVFIMSWSQHYTEVLVKSHGILMLILHPKQYPDDTDLRKVAAEKLRVEHGIRGLIYVEAR